MDKHGILLKLLKEPLFHFLFIGFGLFFIYAQLNGNNEDNKPQIIINQSTLDILSDTFQKEKGKVPTHTEMKNLLKEELHEEILYHEALSLGLDKDDRIIRHRLAQKTKYLFEDVALIDDPSEEDLKAYLKINGSKYINEEGILPDFNSIKHKLRNDWIVQAQQKENDSFFNNLKSHYNIILEDGLEKKFQLDNTIL